MPSNSEEGTWPEQDAVDAWLKKQGIDLPHKETLELKEAVTAPRLDLQRRLAAEKVNYKGWAVAMCSLLDLIESAESLEEVRELCESRFKLAEQYGVEVTFSGLEVSTNKQ